MLFCDGYLAIGDGIEPSCINRFLVVRRELDGRRAGLDDEAGREAMRADWHGRAGVDDDGGAAETSSTAGRGRDEIDV